MSAYRMTTRDLARYWKRSIPKTQELILSFGVWVEDIDEPFNSAQIRMINEGVKKRKANRNQKDNASALDEEKASDADVQQNDISQSVPSTDAKKEEDDDEMVEEKPDGKEKTSELDIAIGLGKQAEEENGEDDEENQDDDEEEEEESLFNTKEQLAQKKLQRYVRDYRIFFDTSSLIQPSCEALLNNLEPLLKAEGRRANIVAGSMKELENFTLVDPSFKEPYKRLTNKIIQMLNNGTLALREDVGENVDSTFMTQFTKIRLQYKLLLVTQNKTLASDILNLNKTQSVQGYNIKIQKVSKYGYLADLFEGTSKEKDSVKPKYFISQNITDASNEPTVQSVPTEGDVVLDYHGNRIKLEERLSNGGEGVVYYTDTDLVAKIYHVKQVTELRKAKLELMVSKKIEHETICWPEQVLYNQKGEFVGFTMKSVPSDAVPLVQVLGPQNIKDEFPSWTKLELAELAKEIIQKIVFLHNNGILLGDINLNNFLVQDSKTVYFIDTDSYQVNEFPCPVGVPEYTPPELQGVHFNQQLRTIENENFAVAVLMFMILMLGKKPYDKIDVQGISSAIKEADFAYPCGEDSTGQAPIGPWRFIWSHLSYQLKETFYSVFRKDEKYYLPEKRVSSKRWEKEINTYIRYLKMIKSQMESPQDEIEKEKRLDTMSIEILPNRFKRIRGEEYKKCRICGGEDMVSKMRAGICRYCLNKGEAVVCERCHINKIVYTNRRKYVEKKGKPKYCKNCKDELSKIQIPLTCKGECGNTFYISQLQKEELEERGQSLPNYCDDCNKKRDNVYMRRQCSGDNCRNLFTITYGEKWFYENIQNYHLPTKCPECRKKAKSRSVLSVGDEKDNWRKQIDDLF